MILLKRLRMINWYAFSNVTVPIGFFTLIAGKNGNGKSVMLDAIKYAAYGDTVFNKSSESKSSRTVSSYVRGLLDATAGTYMRPADKMPNVYTHIVLEYFDDVLDKFFLLGTVIEINAANNYQTYRYVMDKKTLDEVEHTYTEQGVTLPCSASFLQKKYRLTLMNREQGIPRFMQMTGLKLSLSQTSTYLRKLRGIMSYDPNAKIDQFIRESVLEEKNVDFTKLIQAKENIERLNQTFSAIEGEIGELEGILSEYDAYENETNRLLADDIKIAYQKEKGLKAEIEKQTRDKNYAERQREEIEHTLKVLEGQEKELDEQLIRAKISLRELDCMKMIEETERRIQSLKEEKRIAASEKQELEIFQNKVGEILSGFAEEGKEIENKGMLLSLCSNIYSASEKESAVSELKRTVSEAYDTQIKKIALTDHEIEEINQKLHVQINILEECKKRRNPYAQIPDYVGLRDEINREFARRKISSKAKFACEYVIGFSDETWRDAIEAYLGIRRYSILVEPDYYDIADDVLNHSQYKYAHLFNTKLLMEKKTEPENDSPVYLLEIRNPIAKKYFEYQLGRIHAVELSKVRNYENAISKEGRVSVAMDSYFLKLDKIKSYYLGQKTFELNRIRAEREIAQLQEEKKGKLAARQTMEQRKQERSLEKEFFRTYNYDAHQSYQKTASLYHDAEIQLKRLKAAQKNNKEFLELTQLESKLEEQQSGVKKEYNEKVQERGKIETKIGISTNMIHTKSAELEIEEKRLKEYEINFYTVAKKAVEGYEKYLASGSKGIGGLLTAERRKHVARNIEQHKNNLIALQSAYNGKHGDTPLPNGTEHREVYALRKDRIWMDNLQEIRQKLEEQTRRYEEIFKNEFVLTILKSCEKAQEDLKQINLELAKLQFAAKYQFDVHYVKDGSEYAKIIEYAKFLNEREQLGGTAGQMTFDMFTSVSDEEGEQLEKELKQIINRIIEKNSEETIARFADYRNYMTYEILISNQILHHAKLSRQTGFNSGAEVQIPYILILTSALLMIYNQRINATRLVFIDEPFAKMDPGNVKLMIDFMKKQNLQVILCSPDKTESIGNECEVILPVLRVSDDSMQIGIVQFHKENAYG